MKPATGMIWRVRYEITNKDGVFSWVSSSYDHIGTHIKRETAFLKDVYKTNKIKVIERWQEGE